jgi:hypothetical protein
VVCCLDLHVGVVKAPVGNRRAKIDADNSAFSVLSGTTLPRVQTHNRRDRFREDRLSEPRKNRVCIEAVGCTLVLLRPPYAGDERLDLLTKPAPGESRGRDPLGQNSSQIGLAMVKICGLQRGTFMCRNTAGLEGDDLIGAQGYPPKGAHHGDADTTDHPTLGTVFHDHGQSCHGDGMLWPRIDECGCRACRVAPEWAAPQWPLPQWGRHEWDLLEWDALQWDALQWDTYQRGRPEWDPSQRDAPQWPLRKWNALQWPPPPSTHAPAGAAPRGAAGAVTVERLKPAGFGDEHAVARRG